MYDVHQTIQLINYSSQTCLKENISMLKLRNPPMSYEDLIDHIIRFNIPNNVLGSPN
jgi:hypothetical protein